MLKKDVTYVDFDDNKVTDTLYFNLTKSELLDAAGIKAELEAVDRALEGVQRELSIPEIQMMFNVVKKLVQLSYGIRSEDGKRFIKSPQVWEEFTQTPAYDEFLMSLFRNPQEAAAFMMGVVPSDLRSEVQAKVDLQQLQQGVATKLTVAPEPTVVAQPVVPEPPKEETIEELRARLAVLEGGHGGGQ